MSAPALADLDWPRRTERLTIRPVQERDVDEVWSYRSLPEVTRWLGRRPRDRDDLAASLLADPEEPALVVELEGRVVGDLMVRVGDGWAQSDVREQAVRSQAELGWVLAPAVQGRGLAREVVTELLDVCFVGLGVRRVTAVCFADNEPSWRLMEKLGMRREGHSVQDALHADLGWLDGYTYAILATEWPRPRSQ